LLFYPRRRIAAGAPWRRAGAYWRCLAALRDFRADLAFTLEEDAVSHRLTQLSGARFRLGCSPVRHGRGFEHVLPLSFTERPEGRRHRWHSFYEVFQAIGLPEPPPGYLRLNPPPLDAPLRDR